MARVGIITPIHAKDDLDVKWLVEAIESVRAQSFDDWEMVVVNDHSEVEFRDYKDLVEVFKAESRVRGARAQEVGVSNARNLAASMLDTQLLLPLDHDDLLPEEALEKFIKAWPGKGVVYGDVLLKQPNSQRVFAGHKYSFDLLLDHLFMPVGSLHSKADWEKVGGWKPRMNGGLEDWEYWITLGEHGVCGHYVSEVLYIYRRHARGRLATLRTQPEAYARAESQMRQIHLDTYQGRRPVGCCGGARNTTPQGGAAPVRDTREAMDAVATSDLVNVVYIGGSGGNFFVQGPRTSIRYLVQGKGNTLVMPDGRRGVDPKDAPLIARMDRGHAFEIR